MATITLKPSPKIGFNAGTILTVISGLMMVAALYMAFVFAPDAANLLTDVERFSQRILYFHVGAAWVGFFAFFMTFIGGIMYLIRRKIFWDNFGNASVEIGLVFMTMVLVTGSIWAKPTWNVWWTWSPRLTISVIGWLLYVGYLMLRGAIDDPDRRARFSAVFGIVAFVSVPINFMAIRWWRDIHPAVVGSTAGEGQGGFAMSTDMRTTLLFCVIAFTVFYFALLYHRMRVGKTAHEVEVLKQQVMHRL
ncbi:MAG: cytochrome c biogenesis protein CcsA [Chloroflexota bacterium]